MRAPYAPAHPPFTDEHRADSTFSMLYMLGGHREKARTIAANNVALEHPARSEVVEHLIAGFSEQCDDRMADLTYANEAPLLFSTEWVQKNYEAGLKCEQWLRWWAGMRYS